MSLPIAPRTGRLLRWCVLALLCVSFIVLARPALAEPKRAAKREPREFIEPAQPRIARFVYRAEGKRLADVLADFAASQGRPAVIDAQVQGVVTGQFDTTPLAFLNATSRAYGLIWYDDGSALYFYPSSAVQSRIFRLKGYEPKQVQQLMTSLALGDKRYPLRWDARSKTLMVYGPPRHVELVGLAIESLDLGAVEGNRRVAQVIELKFASAQDRRLGAVTVPGVVSVLRSIFGGGNAPVAASGAVEPPEMPASMKGAKAMRSLFGVPAGESAEKKRRPGEPTGTTDRSGAVPTPRPVASPVSEDDEQPVFEADETTNSVIVYARRRRIAEVMQLVRRLDTRPTLVELEAVIIDVSSDSVDQLGVDWSVTTGRTRTSLEGPALSQGTAMAAASGATGTFSVGTVLRNAGREVLARVNALQGEGKARIVSKPKVLGVANRPSTMQDKRIANVRVAGNLDVQLYQVEAGTLLQVTPQVTAQDGRAQIKMSLYIEDGSFEPQDVDGVPIVKRTEIRTEAHVTEGESLLIGGITTDVASNAMVGVPGLSKLPFIGGLFRTRAERSAHIERMFLITPRLVNGEGVRATSSEWVVTAPDQAALRPVAASAPLLPAVSPAAASPLGAGSAAPPQTAATTALPQVAASTPSLQAGASTAWPQAAVPAPLPQAAVPAPPPQAPASAALPEAAASAASPQAAASAASPQAAASAPQPASASSAAPQGAALPARPPVSRAPEAPRVEPVNGELGAYPQP
ncbi:MAG TPA: type III secretion system outer membrane ring subunit SctC [Methylibium sp.]|uniref:type III secretion system outer membrane ring subunit SctC n=1 Tax=Methylibium sp. TaxID=2067992 RepID=UPI002DB65BF6|nr:type III secretion system outer membrane ring subunit SctC [Methylibium sp.]HEU4459577.1 type III secretion system outer membrane ring subunit SctC [Methylibium sp.]